MGFFDRFRKSTPTSKRPAQPHHGAGQTTPDDVDAEIAQCADALRTTATRASGYLAGPIECPALGSASTFTPLAAWALFNPFGPTICALHLIAVPKTGERILFFRALNPFATIATAYGLLPETVAQDSPQLFAVLMRLFAREEGEQATPMPNLPTHIQLVPGSPLHDGQVKELVFAAAKRSDSKTLGVAIGRLKTHKGDPWKRTAVERDETFARLGKGDRSSPKSPTAPPTRAQLEEWWTLVTDPAHVASEVRELPRAWDGAVEFQDRMRKR